MMEYIISVGWKPHTVCSTLFLSVFQDSFQIQKHTATVADCSDTHRFAPCLELVDLLLLMLLS